MIDPATQARLAAEHALHPYHFEALGQFLNAVDVKGRSVLEMGGSNLPRELLFDTLGVSRWVSIDVIGDIHYAKQQQTKHYGRERIALLKDANPQDLERDDYVIYDGMAEEAPQHMDGQFDAIVSITAFEHVLKFDAILRRAYALLKPGGTLFAYYGPIWSGRRGHHVWVSPICNFNNLGPLPEFAHLLYTPSELCEMVKGTMSEQDVTTLLFQMHRSERINRMFYEDYQAFAAASPFASVDIQPYFVQPVDHDTQVRLERLYPGRKRFDAYGQILIARR